MKLFHCGPVVHAVKAFYFFVSSCYLPQMETPWDIQMPQNWTKFAFLLIAGKFSSSFTWSHMKYNWLKTLELHLRWGNYLSFDVCTIRISLIQSPVK